MWQEPKIDWKSNDIPTKDDFYRIEENTKDLKENKLDIDGGDGKDVTVTFAEAATEADITSGDKLSIMFGKILKRLKNIISGTTAVGKAVTLNGLLSTIAELNFVNGVTSAIQTQLNGKAPTNHASTGTSYGIGDANNHGHVKVRNDLVGTETSGATVSPAQITALNNRLVEREQLNVVQITASGNWVVPANVYSVDLVLVGGGSSGSGGSSSGSGGVYGGGRGGNGGEIKYYNNIKVTPGQSIPIIIGAGGAGVSGTNDGNAGGATQFLNSNIFSNGGIAPSKGVGGTNGYPGTGGEYILPLLIGMGYGGGGGGTASSTSSVGGGGGGGGSSAGGTGAPNGATGGTAGTGGIAGSPAPTGSGGNAKVNSGSGGGGLGSNGSGSSGAGGSGICIIIY